MNTMLRIVKDNTKGGRPPLRVFTLFQDGRKGWLYVSFKDLDDVGLTPYSFSAFSRIDEKGMYLEEEMDAQIFTEVYEQKAGFRVVFNEIHEEPAALRKKQSNVPINSQDLWEKRKAPSRVRVVR